MLATCSAKEKVPAAAIRKAKTLKEVAAKALVAVTRKAKVTTKTLKEAVVKALAAATRKMLKALVAVTRKMLRALVAVTRKANKKLESAMKRARACAGFFCAGYLA